MRRISICFVYAIEYLDFHSRIIERIRYLLCIITRVLYISMCFGNSLVHYHEIHV